MPTCPICGVTVLDPSAYGGMGNGPLPDHIKNLDGETYNVFAIQDDENPANYSYFVDRKYIHCDSCHFLLDAFLYHPSWVRKILNILTESKINTGLKQSIREYSRIWKDLSDA